MNGARCGDAARAVAGIRNGGPMKNRLAVSIKLCAILLACGGSIPFAFAQTSADAPAGIGGAVEQKLQLTAAQRNAIYQAVSKDTTKAAKIQFPATIGADVPPMLQLYTLPDDFVASNPAAELYRYTLVQDRVVLIDPTKMRVIEVIGPPP
jgi:hypothetical protein